MHCISLITTTHNTEAVTSANWWRARLAGQFTREVKYERCYCNTELYTRLLLPSGEARHSKSVSRLQRVFTEAMHPLQRRLLHGWRRTKAPMENPQEEL